MGISYNPAVADQSGAIRAGGMTAWSDAAQNIAGSLAGAIKSYAAKRDETEHMRGMMEGMAQDDPEIASQLESFEKAGYGKKQGILAQALVRYKRGMETKDKADAAKTELDTYAKKRAIDAKYKEPKQEFDPATDLAPYQTPDGSTVYFNKKTGGQVDLPRPKGTEEIKPIPGTNYQGIFRDGRFIQALPVAGADPSERDGQITWPDGSVTVKAQGIKKDFVPDGKGNLVTPSKPERAAPPPKIIARKSTDADGNEVKEYGYFRIDEESGEPVWMPEKSEPGEDGGASGGGSIFDRIKKRMQQGK